MNKLHYIFHLSLYYAAWAVCLLLAANGKGGSGAFFVLFLSLIQYCWQWKVRKHTQGLLTLTLLLSVIGSLIDTIFVWSNLIIFASNPFAPYFTAPWMISLWISFSIIAFATLSKLFTRYYLVSCLAFLGFSIAYAIGVQMGAASFPHGYKTSILIGLVWGIMLPLCFYLYQRMMHEND